MVNHCEIIMLFINACLKFDETWATLRYYT